MPVAAPLGDHDSEVVERVTEVREDVAERGEAEIVPAASQRASSAARVRRSERASFSMREPSTADAVRARRGAAKSEEK